MTINYYPETDSVYIDLSLKTSIESVEISEGVVLDNDEDCNLVGIDIDNASTKLDLTELIFNRFLVKVHELLNKILKKM